MMDSPAGTSLRAPAVTHDRKRRSRGTPRRHGLSYGRMDSSAAGQDVAAVRAGSRSRPLWPPPSGALGVQCPCAQRLRVPIKASAPPLLLIEVPSPPQKPLPGPSPPAPPHTVRKVASTWSLPHLFLNKMPGSYGGAACCASTACSHSEPFHHSLHPTGAKSNG